MIEVWKSIPDYEGIYEVSSLGRVKSLSRTILRKGKYPFKSKEKILKQRIDKYGYCRLNLSNSIQKTVHVHKIVAMTFLNHKPCGLDLVIDHKNDIKTDNRVENLQIVTQRENAFKTQGNYSSKYKGVGFDNSRNKWYSRIYVDGKTKHLGRFESEYYAHLAYQQALKEIQ